MRLRAAITKFLTYCDDYKNLADKTLSAYESDLGQLSAALGNRNVGGIRKAEILKYYDGLVARELKPRSIKRKIACMKAMWRWLEVEEIIDINPFPKTNLPIKLPKQLPKDIQRGDLRRLLSYLALDAKAALKKIKQRKLVKLSDDDWVKLTTFLAIELMTFTGLRIGELTQIRLSDINIESKKIKIKGKGQRERFVFLSDEKNLNRLLQYSELRAQTTSTSNLLFLSRRKTPLSSQTLRKHLYQATKAAGIKSKITPHMFRHTAACQLLEVGVDIRFVQRLLGHESLVTTQIYTHVNDQVLQEKINSANIRVRLIER